MLAAREEKLLLGPRAAAGSGLGDHSSEWSATRAEVRSVTLGRLYMYRGTLSDLTLGCDKFKFKFKFKFDRLPVIGCLLFM